MFAPTRIQVAGIYFHPAIEKLAVKEWAGRTAFYYWFTTFRAAA